MLKLRSLKENLRKRLQHLRKLCLRLTMTWESHRFVVSKSFCFASVKLFIACEGLLMGTTELQCMTFHEVMKVKSSYQEVAVIEAACTIPCMSALTGCSIKASILNL